MLSAPALTGATPTAFRRLIQQVYRHFDRGLIQFDPACARYDSGLAYTLKPGTCTFENVEFRNTVSVNRVGLRDDDAALEAPEVIVLGDSHVMGWGVEGEETLASVLARKTGLRVLNAGVSSYGTAREMMMLDRLDTSALKTLVIQYADNDLPENRSFREHDGRLPIMSEAEYQNIVDHYANQRSYYPGKYMYRLFMKISGLEEPEPDQLRMDPVEPDAEAALFLDVLTRGSHVSLDGVRIIVFEVNEQIRPPRPFIGALDRVARQSDRPASIQQLTVLDIAPLLTTADFYALDDHMRPHGHEVIGNALTDLMAKDGGPNLR
jgi:hypothetical protein